MNWRLLAVLGAGTAALLGSLACSSEAPNGAGSAGNASGTSGASNGGAGGADVVGSGGLATSACLEAPSPQRTQGTVLSLPLELVMAGKSFVFGQPNVLADGGTLVPLNLRFYISEVELLRAGGEEPIAVDVVTATGALEPYGVHFFNAEDADSATLRLLAPPGDYTGLSFSLGIKLDCNRERPANLSDPLSDASQMTWPHAGGFLFLRYEGRYTGPDSGGASAMTSPAGIPPAVHMGGDISKELVPRVTVSASGALSIPASGRLEKRLSVVMDELFKGATSNVDIGDVSSGLLSAPESRAGERLRRELSELHAFVLEP